MQSRVPVYSGHSPLRLYLIISWPGPGPPPCVMKTIHCNFCKLSNKGNQWNKKKVSLCIPSGNQIVLIMMCVEQNTLFFIGRYLSSALIYVCTQCGSCHMLVCPYAVPLLMMRDRVTILWSPDHRWPVLPARQWWWRVLGCSRYIGIPPPTTGAQQGAGCHCRVQMIGFTHCELLQIYGFHGVCCYTANNYTLFSKISKICLTHPCTRRF